MKYLIVIFTFFSLSTNAQMISTIAGNGSYTSTGDGGPATAAGVMYPSGTAVDASGNIYVSEGNKIRMINPAGIISTYAGTGVSGYSGDGGPATAAQLKHPQHIALDAVGNLYVCDSLRIRKINTAGIITTIAGNGIAGYSGDGGPATLAQIATGGIAIDGAGNVYFTDRYHYVVRKINTAGIITTVAGNGTLGYTGDGGPATSATLGNASGLALDTLGNLYVGDQYYGGIRKINTSGIITTIAGNGIPAFGSYSYSGDGGQATAADLGYTNGIVIDKYGNIYVGQTNATHKVRMINPSGIITTVAGLGDAWVNLGDGGPAQLGGIIQPNQLALDTAGNLYFGCNNHRVRKVSPGGILSIVLYYDANGNCTKDATDPCNYSPVVFEVDSNGTPVDTISATGSITYLARGKKGDIYRFKLLSIGGNMYATCPSTGIITDTILSKSFYYSSKSIGLSCAGAGTGFDLAELVTSKAGKHRYEADITLYNSYCSPQSATFTTHINPKYNLQSAYPNPASTSGNTVTWNFTGVSTTTAPQRIHFACEVPGAWLLPGDTVKSDFDVSPSSGDANPANNTCIKIDTVRSSFDPNEIDVTPAGYITAGIQLQYDIEFENDGNDTAQDIYVLDTLSQYVDAGSMRILGASANMNTTLFKVGNYRIVKFDFPHIKLLDSSHHNQCTGTLHYTINTKAGLAPGTQITNRAGIYFDDNPVVMTNEVTNTIGFPNGVGTSDASNKAQLYPNPASNVLTIKNAGYLSFSINNSMGTEIMHQPLTDKLTTVNIEQLPTSIYFVRLIGDSGIEVIKFIKQ